MRLNKTLGTTLIALAATLLLSACPNQPTKGQEATGATVGGASSHPDRGRRQGKYTAADLNNPVSPLYQRTIYFDYDSSDIRPRFLDTLRAHASYLSSDPAAQVTLDGHTDERGTREYNLALGYHRAGAVRDFLRAEGAPPGRLRTMSYGEEQPAELGHTETAWSRNRRVELVY